ncbi:universal stress protein [Nocardia ignorata]|uniref:Nucleotide-binding universal stress UspA family protein n=1 Tax=Nocardia ignorata TaxID=145285 RepID=A0A4R6P6B7_NOCIG|nr:universal stress protein [Nocardia ignorata]TDP31529.1 nucleotide-binding universal stress UspA family protein [Nocardia ignorata]
MTTHHIDPPTEAPVVVGIDGSEVGAPAVRWAAETAAARNRRLRIVHAVDLTAAHILLDPYELPMASVTEAMRDFSADCLAAARRLAQAVDPALVIETATVDGTPAPVLVKESTTAHLITLGAAGLSGGGLFGSTLLAVAAHAHGLVVVVRGSEPEQPSRDSGPVVVGIDDSDSSHAAVGAAFAEACERHTELVVVHCWSDLRFGWFAGLPDLLDSRSAQADAHELITEQLAGWTDKYPHIAVERKVYLSGPSHHLIDWSRSAQLVVVGNRGRGGFPGLQLGSTSNALIQCGQCPIMIVHPRSG